LKQWLTKAEREHRSSPEDSQGPSVEVAS
jgi:hypothetical protein